MKSVPAGSLPIPKTVSASVQAGSRAAPWVIAASLAFVTIALYWPVTNHDFVSYDDELYVTANAQVQQGLAWSSLKWAFFNGERYLGYWHPLTLLSHMADCQFYGLRPRGHHLTSVLLHAANTALGFLLCYRLTGTTQPRVHSASEAGKTNARGQRALWRSAMVGALFGWHPLHVESVAWIAARKDVLSTCFGFLALLAYARYATRSEDRTLAATSENPETTRAQSLSAAPRSTLHVCLWYCAALSFFTLGLMSKPMLVTWPFLMLLLDFWPLKRLKAGRLMGLVAEKIPFFALAALASVAALIVQEREGALTAGAGLPLGARIGNALISYCRYLGKCCWPTNLAIFYPHPGHWLLGWVALAGLLVLGITALVLALRRAQPFLLVGWFWFVGLLVPVIGLVQVGAHSMADRYTYVSFLGLFLIVAWGGYELAQKWRYRAILLAPAAVTGLVACLALTRQQLSHWKDSESLFRHALEATKDNYLAHKALGDALAAKGQSEEAIRQYQEALRLSPRYSSAHNNFGNALLKRGDFEGAIGHLQEAIRLNPRGAEAYYNLGTAFLRKGRIDEAIAQYREAIRRAPWHANSHYNLGVALYYKGQIDEAISQYQEALQLAPAYAEVHNYLGLALGRKNASLEAIRQFREAIRLKPEYAPAHLNLGDLLRVQGQIDEAIGQYRQAIRLKPDDAQARNRLAAALASKGEPPKKSPAPGNP